jgi:N-formylglutamate deformylase
MIQSKFNFSDSSEPVLALAIHHGHHLPSSLLPYTPISADTRYREEDPYTGDIAAYYANHIIIETSRFAVDLNRSPQRAIYLKPQDAWGLKVRSDDMPDSIVQELQDSYKNWYALLRYQMDRMLSQHPFVFVFDIHSYNHRRKGPDAEPDPQAENPDIILGRSNMISEFYPLVDDLRERLDGQDFFGHKLDVRCDVKFPGGQLSRWLHDTYPERLICIAVEFKKIFMDEHSGKLNPVSLNKIRQLFLQQSSAWVQDNLK